MLACENECKLQKIMQFISPRRSRCLYIYLDLMRYGIENSEVRAWADKFDKMSSVAMRYHNGMHLCADMDADYSDIADLVMTEQPAMVLGERQTIDKLSKQLQGLERPSYGVVMRATQIIPHRRDNIERANKCDAKEIAELVMSDISIGSGYTIKELASQIIERLEDGYGRNYVLRSAGDIIAHVGTGAESGGVATIVDVIVRNDCRGQGLGRKLVSAISSDVIKEGMIPHLFCYSSLARKLYESIGYEVECEWARIELANRS